MTLTFPLADADLDVRNLGKKRDPWRAHGDKQPAPPLDPRAHEPVRLMAARLALLPASRPPGEHADDDDDDDDDDDVDVKAEEQGDPTELDELEAGQEGPLTVLWRNVYISGCKVHIRIWQRGDAWGLGRGGDNWGDRWWASVAFNPSRLRDPGGWQVCPAQEAQTWACAILIWLARRGIVVPQCDHLDAISSEHCEVTASWHRQTGELLKVRRLPTGRAGCEDVECLLHTVTVSRIDAALDFSNVMDTTLYPDLLMGHRQSRLGKKRKYSDHSAAAWKGETGLRVAIYDKCVEGSRYRDGREVAPQGTVRIESRARAPKLKRVMTQDIHKTWLAEPRRESSRKLAFVTPELISQIFYEGYQWAGFDRWVGGDHRLEPARINNLTPTMAARLRKFIDDHAAGRDPAVSGNTRLKYERLAVQFGKVLGLNESRSSGPLRHLDVLQGVEQRPSVLWRMERGLTGINSGAAVTVILRRVRRAVASPSVPLGRSATGHPSRRASSVVDPAFQR